MLGLAMGEMAASAAANGLQAWAAKLSGPASSS